MDIACIAGRTAGVLFASAVMMAPVHAATILAQGDVSVSTPGDYPISPSAPNAVPFCCTSSNDYLLELAVNGGTLTDAYWEIDGNFTANWWEYTSDPDNPLFLNGEEYFGGTFAENNSQQDFAFFPSVDFRVTSTLAPSDASLTIQDLSDGFNVCANPSAVPVGSDCSEGGTISGLYLNGFTVDASSDFHWTLSLGPVPGVPEPSTWLMLVAGFALIGTTLRRRSGPRVA